MNYREIVPSPELSRYIHCYWFLSGANDAAVTGVQPILPDGRMEIVLNLGDPFRRAIDGEWERQPLAMIVGQMSRPVVVAPSGLVDLVGVRFHPWGARAFIDEPLRLFNEKIPSLDDALTGLSRLVKDHDAELRERRTVASLERVLLSALRPRGIAPSAVEWAARQIVNAKGVTSVSDTAKQVGMTGRQLERKFLDGVGIGPKRLCRLLRFQEALRAAQQQPKPNWAQIAAGSGYFDQTHLIRDFREFAGSSPATLQLSENSLTALTLAADIER